MRRSHLVVKSLTHGSWSGNTVNRKPPRGGGSFDQLTHMILRPHSMCDQSWSSECLWLMKWQSLLKNALTHMMLRPFSSNERLRKKGGEKTFQAKVHSKTLTHIYVRGKNVRKRAFTYSLWVLSRRICMGWLRLVSSWKLQVSFAKEPYKRECILQKRPII